MRDARRLGRPRRARRRLRLRVPPPPLRRDRAPVVGVEPHPPLVALARRRTRAAARRRRPRRHRAGAARAGRLGRRRPRPLGLLLRARLRARAARARAGRTPRRGGVRRRQRRHPVDVRPLVPPRLPDGRPRHRGAVLVRPGLGAGAADDRLALRDPRRPRGGGAHRARPRDRRRRARRARGAWSSTTPSTSGGAASDPPLPRETSLRYARDVTAVRPRGPCGTPARFWSLPAPQRRTGRCPQLSGPSTCGRRPEADLRAGSDQKPANGPG